MSSTDPSDAPGGFVTSDPAAGLDDPTYGATFWIGLVLGGSVMAYAVWGAIQAFSSEQQVQLMTWLLGSALAHDVILAPTVTIVGLLLAWVLPRSIRGPVLGALAMSGIVLLFSWSSLRGFGRRDVNPSILPHDYATNVAIVIGCVWAAALAVIVLRIARARRP